MWEQFTQYQIGLKYQHFDNKNISCHKLNWRNLAEELWWCWFFVPAVGREEGDAPSLVASHLWPRPLQPDPGGLRSWADVLHQWAALLQLFTTVFNLFAYICKHAAGFWNDLLLPWSQSLEFKISISEAFLCAVGNSALQMWTLVAWRFHYFWNSFFISEIGGNGMTWRL